MTADELAIYDGEELRSAQRDSGMTAVALAEEVDISREALFDYMSGVSVPRANTLAHMCMVMARGKPQTARRMLVKICGLAPRRTS